MNRNNNQTQQGKYLLFYSDQCNDSKQFLSELYKNIDLYRTFIKINIDTQRIKIPNYITHVPAIIVPNQKTGKKDIYQGDGPFQWLDSLSKRSGSSGGSAVSNQPGGVADFDPAGMSGFSDSYTFLDDTDPRDKQFTFLGKQNDTLITPPDDGLLNDSDKKGKEGMDRALEELQRARDASVPPPINRQGGASLPNY